MDKQEETLIRQSKWNGRRVVLLYWTAIVFLGTAAAAGLGTGILNPRLSVDKVAFDHSTTFPAGSKWYPENCSSCHKEAYDAWNATGHADSTYRINDTHIWRMSKPVNESYFNTRDCINCHATRYENTTATTGNDAVDDIWSFGVTCASCHEEPGTIDYTKENCGKCHSAENSTISPGHHSDSQYEDCNMSAHAQSFNDLLASDHASDSCLHCMSGQGTYAGDGTYGIQATELLLNNSVITSINCATCHDPHDATNQSQFRQATINEVCGMCHSGSSRHTTLEMFTDSTTPSDHGTLDCTACHGYQLAPGHGGGEENRMNHTWALDYESCVKACHNDTAAARVQSVEDIQENITTLLDEYEDLLENVTTKVDDANATAGVDQPLIDDSYNLIAEAKSLVMFVDGDASTGFHNPDLAEERLELALKKLNEAYTKAEEAAPSGGSTPGFEFIPILAAIAILTSSFVLIRKIRKQRFDN